VNGGAAMTDPPMVRALRPDRRNASPLASGFTERELAVSVLKDIVWLFNGRHFDREVIALSVRWYLRYKLSLRHLVEIMSDRGLSLSPPICTKSISKRRTPDRWQALRRSATGHRVASLSRACSRAIAT
jgi:hypothetical protein